MRNWIKWLRDIKENDINLAGGKAVNLGKMMQTDLPVPTGFCLTTPTFASYTEDILLEYNDSIENAIPLDAILDLTDRVRLDLQDKPIPGMVQSCILEEYSLLMGTMEESSSLAVRSSATSEDLKESSFAGLFETYLGVDGNNALLEKVKACWLAIFNERVVSYCFLKQISPFRLKMGVIVQEMIDCVKAGTMFTTHPVTGDQSVIIIEAGWGLGNIIVSGNVSPDSYTIDKKTLKILNRKIATKKQESRLTTNGVVTLEVSEEKQNIPCLNDEETLNLANMAIKVEAIQESGQDIEWGISRNSDKIYLLQTRPITGLWTI